MIATAVEEEVACEDHVMAHRLSGSNVVSEIRPLAEALEGDLLSKLAGHQGFMAV